MQILRTKFHGRMGFWNFLVLTYNSKERQKVEVICTGAPGQNLNSTPVYTACEELLSIDSSFCLKAKEQIQKAWAQLNKWVFLKNGILILSWTMDYSFVFINHIFNWSGVFWDIYRVTYQHEIKWSLKKKPIFNIWYEMHNNSHGECHNISRTPT